MGAWGHAGLRPPQLGVQLDRQVVGVEEGEAAVDMEVLGVCPWQDEGEGDRGDVAGVWVHEGNEGFALRRFG